MQQPSIEGQSTQPRVALFATCLVDFFRPAVGFASARLLEAAGCRVEVPDGQTCCGQPAFNSGDDASARAIARQVIALFASYDYVVAPSGSCAGMIKCHYPKLFSDDLDMLEQARQLAEKTFELTQFLVDICSYQLPSQQLQATLAYHDSCSGVREMGIYEQPRSLLTAISGLTLTTPKEADSCCGFGGTFCVKYPAISARLLKNKQTALTDTDADLISGGDLGCLLNIAGGLRRAGDKTKVYHVAELLDGCAGQAGIGEDKG
ncbi:MAG TPA: (Fe-S)-binding protein [Gammaproteobacteria bacterium]|nr:(Fe-S)-binding protein [Gammaproteobacteria bacterium]